MWIIQNEDMSLAISRNGTWVSSLNEALVFRNRYNAENYMNSHCGYGCRIVALCFPTEILNSIGLDLYD